MTLPTKIRRVALLPALFLGACDDIDLTTANFIRDVQSTATAVCSFMPVIETITGIAATFGAGSVPATLPAVEAVVDKICANVVTPKRTFIAVGSEVVVGEAQGVEIRGYFVEN